MRYRPAPLWSDRRVKPAYGCAEVNWAHPLARNLVLCLLFNETGRVILDPVSGAQVDHWDALITRTPRGTVKGCGSSTHRLAFTLNKLAGMSLHTGPLTMVSRFNQPNLNKSSNPLYIPAGDGSVACGMWEFGVDADYYHVLQRAGVGGGTNNRYAYFSPSNPFDTAFRTWVVSDGGYGTASSTMKCYVDGQERSGAILNAGTTPIAMTYPFGASEWLYAQVLCGYYSSGENDCELDFTLLFNRTMTQDEARWFAAEPFAFLKPVTRRTSITLGGTYKIQNVTKSAGAAKPRLHSPLWPDRKVRPDSNLEIDRSHPLARNLDICLLYPTGEDLAGRVWTPGSALLHWASAYGPMARSDSMFNGGTIAGTRMKDANLGESFAFEVHPKLGVNDEFWALYQTSSGEYGPSIDVPSGNLGGTVRLYHDAATALQAKFVVPTAKIYRIVVTWTGAETAASARCFFNGSEIALDASSVNGAAPLWGRSSKAGQPYPYGKYPVGCFMHWASVLPPDQALAWTRDPYAHLRPKARRARVFMTATKPGGTAARLNVGTPIWPDRWRQKPPYGEAEIDWQHPLAQGLCGLWLYNERGAEVDLVSGILFVPRALDSQNVWSNADGWCRYHEYVADPLDVVQAVAPHQQLTTAYSILVRHNHSQKYDISLFTRYSYGAVTYNSGASGILALGASGMALLASADWVSPNAGDKTVNWGPIFSSTAVSRRVAVGGAATTLFSADGRLLTTTEGSTSQNYDDPTYPTKVAGGSILHVSLAAVWKRPLSAAELCAVTRNPSAIYDMLRPKVRRK